MRVRRILKEQNKFLLITAGVLLILIVRWWEASLPNQNYGPSLCRYGISYFEKGSFFKAVSFFRKAVKYDPNQAEAYLYLGKSLFLLSRYDEAIEFLQESVALDPHLDEAFYILATIYYNQGKKEQTVFNLRQALKYQQLNFPGNYYYLLGICALETGDMELAYFCAAKIRRNGRLFRLADLLDAQMALQGSHKP